MSTLAGITVLCHPTFHTLGPQRDVLQAILSALLCAQALLTIPALKGAKSFTGLLKTKEHV